MGNVVRDVVVFRQHVGAKVPHAKRRGKVVAFHLQLKDFERVLDGVVLKRLRDAFVGADGSGDRA